MNDEQNRQPIATDDWLGAGPKNAQLIYILFLASFLLSGIPAIIGLVMAYMNRGKAGGFTETHYTWLIRTFWIGLLYSLIAAILIFVMIGMFVAIAVAIWAVIRVVKGLMALGRNEPIPDPQSWWI
ncbi:hypothetical protein WNY59_00685 [Ahrensia kielensis]|uniref:DUF4870 domain-containing protein n=1 Tax=Ahrensia kielensis TaxID=76980 RepID=A0ABU9T1T6_9HYPH